MSSGGSPTGLESNISSDSPLPKIPGLSTHASSSDDSFDSSRPNSKASSSTSLSTSPSSTPEKVLADKRHECIELPAIPLNPPLPESALPSQPSSQNEPPRSIPPSAVNHETSWFSRLGSLISRINWFTNTLAAMSLALTLIGMIIFGWRSYKLAIWSAWNQLLATCGQLKSSDVALNPDCEGLLSKSQKDLVLPPYKHWKRILNATFEAGWMPSKIGLIQRSSQPTGGSGDGPADSSFSYFLSVATVLASTVIIGGVSLIVLRRYWRTEEVFTSPARSDWQLTRYHEEGPETVSGEWHHMIRRNPEDHHPLGQLREKIRKSQPNAVENPTGEPISESHNTSQETLVGPWEEAKWGTSKVSLRNDTSDEKHENLIELETEGPNKTFFDPETGEFIHLTPWKSTGDEEIHGLKPDGKGSIKRAFAQMTLGATGWAGGKDIDDQLAEELQANSKDVKKKPGELRAGDGITGDMINEPPSGKSTMV